MKIFMNNLVEIPYFDVVSYPDAKFLQFTGEVSHLITDPDTTTSLQKPAPPPNNNRSILAPSSTNLHIHLPLGHQVDVFRTTYTSIRLLGILCTGSGSG